MSSVASISKTVPVLFRYHLYLVSFSCSPADDDARVSSLFSFSCPLVSCPRNCSGHGRCGGADVGCICQQNFVGRDCSIGKKKKKKEIFFFFFYFFSMFVFIKNNLKYVCLLFKKIYVFFLLEIRDGCVQLPNAPKACVDVEAQNCTQFVKKKNIHHCFLLLFCLTFFFFLLQTVNVTVGGESVVRSVSANQLLNVSSDSASSDSNLVCQSVGLCSACAVVSEFAISGANFTACTEATVICGEIEVRERRSRRRRRR